MLTKRIIGEQRKVLTTLLEPIMLRLSKQCAQLWSSTEGLDEVLSAYFPSIPHCHLVYAIDKFGKQISANVNNEGIDANYRHQDLSRRPYSVSLYPKRHFMLSSVYISQASGQPCISAVQPVMDEQQFLGFVVADFDVRHLPFSIHTIKEPFSNASTSQRLTSIADLYLEDIARALEKLISEHGVFHGMLHYSSAQMVLWQVNEPLHYRLYKVEQILEPTIFHVYPRCLYPQAAALSLRQVRQVLERFSTLRLASDNSFLRSGSINVINGMVSLSFSSEGSQYLLAEAFLGKDLSHWLERTTGTDG